MSFKTAASEAASEKMSLSSGGNLTVSGRILVDDATDATNTTDGSLQTDGGLSVAKSAVIGDNLDLMSNSAIFKIGSDNAFTLTHSNANNTVLATADHRLAFGDAGEYISGDGTDLKIISSGDVDITATLVDVTGALTASGIIKTDDATDATSTTDGSLQTDGGLSVVKDGVFGNDVKLLSDSAVLSFGANSEITLTHSHDAGLNLKHTATADDKPIILTLQTGETDIAANDKLGVINFQAPDEGTDTDAVLVAAGIEAISEGDFSSSNNATKLSFKTAASEAASEKMSLSSAGNLTVSGRILVDDATDATNTTDGSLQTDGGLSVAKSAVIGDNLDLMSNSAIFKIGSDNAFTLTHSNANNTVLATADHRLAFGDAGEYISGDGTDLKIISSGDVDITA